MLVERIQKDLYDFAGHDPDDFAGLVEFWYQANSEVLSASLAAKEGLNLIVNVSNFRSFENLSKKLFLVADTLVLRDTRTWKHDENEFHTIPIPTGEYKPGYYEDVREQLRGLRPSPLTLLYRPTLYWTSATKHLNNGYQVAYAGWDYNAIPEEFIEWLRGPGESYMKTSKVIYAPFIPSLDMELEFLKQGVNLPDTFGTVPCFHQNCDWPSKESVQALLSLQMPFLDNIDIETLDRVKSDYHDEFTRFSRTLLEAADNVKASAGTPEFNREIRNIQKNLIDAGLSDIDKTLRRIESYSALRKLGILIVTIGVDAAAFLGGAVPGLVTGLTSAAAAVVSERVLQLKEQNELRDKKAYFLWRVKNVGDNSKPTIV